MNADLNKDNHYQSIWHSMCVCICVGCIVKERTAITEEILTAGSSSSLCNHKNLNREIIISVHIKLIHLVVRVCAK